MRPEVLGEKGVVAEQPMPKPQLRFDDYTFLGLAPSNFNHFDNSIKKRTPSYAELHLRVHKQHGARQQIDARTRDTVS